MWSLPDINRMNAQAATEKNAILQQTSTGKIGRKRIRCENHEKKVATFIEPYYDIFSNDPKGIIAMCDECWEERGCPDPDEYFQCAICAKYVVDHYTWERYCTEVDEGTACLPCALGLYLADPESGYDLTNLDEVNDLTLADFKQVKHLIGVEMPLPDGLTFHENVESLDRSEEVILGMIKEVLTRLHEAGEKRAYVILDAAYQFSVSLGIYTFKVSETA